MGALGLARKGPDKSSQKRKHGEGMAGRDTDQLIARYVTPHRWTPFFRDASHRYGMQWYSRVGRRVWLHEVWSFIVRDRRTSTGPMLAAF